MLAIGCRALALLRDLVTLVRRLLAPVRDLLTLVCCLLAIDRRLPASHGVGLHAVPGVVALDSIGLHLPVGGSALVGDPALLLILNPLVAPRRILAPACRQTLVRLLALGVRATLAGVIWRTAANGARRRASEVAPLPTIEALGASVARGLLGVPMITLGSGVGAVIGAPVGLPLLLLLPTLALGGEFGAMRAPVAGGDAITGNRRCRGDQRTPRAR